MADTIQIPGYEILRPLGSGGMSTVYLALQRSLDRKVAIKVMRRSLSGVVDDDRQLEKRFLLEGRMMAKLPHRNIVAVYDIVSNESVAYIAMEYLGGGSLTDRMRSGLSLADAVSVIVQISSALEFAHGHGVVHRDLKPANIMFRDNGTPVLTDFGIARYQDGSGTRLTQTGMLVGTPTYMSPEQINGLPVDGRADQYSLGILFYELLTGAPPFRADTPIAVLMAHLTQQAAPLPQEFRSFQPVFDRILAKDREQRYETLQEFADDLKSRLVNSDTLLMKLQIDPNQTSSEQLRALGFYTSTPSGAGIREAALRTPSGPRPIVRPPAPSPAPKPAAGGATPAARTNRLSLIAAGAVALLVVVALAIWAFSGRGQLSKDEQELVSFWLKQADAYVAENKLVEPPDQNAYAYAQKVLQKDPKNEDAERILGAIAAGLGRRAEQALQKGELETASDAVKQGLLVHPDDAALVALGKRVDAAQAAEKLRQQVETLLAGAQQAEKSGQVFGDAGAYTLLGRARTLRPDDATIGQRIEAIVQEQLAAPRKALQGGQPATARDELAKLETYLGSDKAFVDLKGEVDAALKQQQAERQLGELVQRGTQQIREGHLDAPAGANAYETFGQIRQIGAEDKRANEFAAALARAALEDAKRLEGKQPERALDRAGLALRVDPQLADALALKARIEQRLGERATRISQALGAIRQAIAEQRFVAPAPDDARSALEALLKLDPENADARQLAAELPRRIADAIAARIDSDANAASNLLKAARAAYPQEAAFAQLATKLDAQAAREREAQRLQAARDSLARTIAAGSPSVEDLRGAILALGTLLAADGKDKAALDLRRQFVAVVARQLGEAQGAAEFDARARVLEGQDSLFRGEEAYAELRRSQASLRAKIVDAEQARLAAQAGELVLNAYPWGTVESVVDSNRKAVPLPADATTPLVLSVPAGSYVITFRHPKVDKAAQVIAKVEAKKRVSANATFPTLSAQDYFSRAGWQ